MEGQHGWTAGLAALLALMFGLVYELLRFGDVSLAEINPPAVIECANECIGGVTSKPKGTPNKPSAKSSEQYLKSGKPHETLCRSGNGLLRYKVLFIVLVIFGAACLRNLIDQLFEKGFDAWMKHDWRRDLAYSGAGISLMLGGSGGLVYGFWWLC